MNEVYVINAVGTDFYKIGMSRDAENRLKDLQVGSPYDLRVIAKIETDKAVVVERKIHSTLHNMRVRGEWFEIPLGVVRNIVEAFVLFSMTGVSPV